MISILLSTVNISKQNYRTYDYITITILQDSWNEPLIFILKVRILNKTTKKLGSFCCSMMSKFGDEKIRLLTIPLWEQKLGYLSSRQTLHIVSVYQNWEEVGWGGEVVEKKVVKMTDRLNQTGTEKKVCDREKSQKESPLKRENL